MNRHQQFLTSSLAIASLVGMSASSFAVAIYDSANVNVMRQYLVAPGSATFLVPHVTTIDQAGINRDGPANNGYVNDGSGWNVETGPGFTAGKLIQQVFTLGQPATVGSFRIEWDGTGRIPTTFELEGSMDNANWFEFGTAGQSTYTPPTLPSTALWNNSFIVPKTVKYIRYTATGPAIGNGTIFGFDEMQVFMTTGQTINTGAGYDFLRDKQVASKVTLYNSSSTGLWAAPNGGSAANLVDGTYSDQVKAQNTNGNANALRAYVGYSLTDGSAMTLAANVGSLKGESLSNWEFYTTNNDALWAGLAGLTDVSSTGIQAAGWILQHAQVGAAGSPGIMFPLLASGNWKDFLFAWNIQQNSVSELELFAPEPGTLSLLALGGLALLRRRR